MNSVQMVPEPSRSVKATTTFSSNFVRGTRAFTLIECLVVISIIAVIAALLLPALAKSKRIAQSSICQNNLKLLQLAWHNYADDHEDSLPPNISRQIEFEQVNVEGSWVLGNAVVDTNTDNLKKGVLYPYVRAGSVFHCPADKSTVRDRRELIRTRSYSISLWLNVDLTNYGNADLATADPCNKHKLARIIDPPPSKTWVFIDEHPLSIDDGVFLIARGNDFGHWSSYRGDCHNNGANLSFADTHVEHYPWRCRRQFRQYNFTWTRAVDADDRADLRKLEAGLPHSP